jgi:hypothetical protein
LGAYQAKQKKISFPFLGINQMKQQKVSSHGNLMGTKQMKQQTFSSHGNQADETAESFLSWEPSR